MKKSIFQKSLSVFLAALTVAGVLAVPISAANEGDLSTGEGSTSALPADESSGTHGSLELIESLDLISYKEYTALHSDASRTNTNVKVNGADYDPDNTTGDVEVVENYEGMDGTSLRTPSSGTVSWKVNFPESGKYAMRITYYSEAGTSTTIERKLFIDGEIPFSEARYFYFPRVWKYQTNEDGSFETDINGNDIRPIRVEDPAWQTYFLRDWLGYTMSPFEFYFEAGEHVITLDAAREPMVISSIEFYRYEEEPSYNDFVSSMNAKGVYEIKNMKGGPITIQAENPTNVSNANLYPTNDRTSALTYPQDPAVIKYNILNSSVVNQWMEYKVTVPESGLYRISFRYRQNDLIGMFTSRRVYINDEIQFSEANHLRFPYTTGWQSKALNDGQSEFLFYFEEGENTVKIEIVLGDMTEYVYEMQQIISELNDVYQTFIMLTGPTPDSYRDYGFDRICPDEMESLRNCAKRLYDMADSLTEITGQLGDQVATLNTVAILLEKMGNSQYQVAPNFTTFKNYIITLSNWLYAALAQPLKLDSFTVGGTDDAMPKAKPNFFSAAWFEIKAFVMSFVMDYTTIGYKSDVESDPENTVEIWIASAGGRDDALIQRHLIDNYFTPQTGISVTIKVTTAGLTEAILAGIGPDVAAMSSTDCVTWGLRNAVEVLNDYDGYDEVMSWYDEAVTTPLTLYGKTYGIPSSLSFNMMFYRKDVLEDLGISAPDTWDDMYDILPVFLNKHMEIGMAGSLGGTAMFLYQMGGELFADDGKAINLDSNVGLDAFETICDMFSKYKCPVSYDMTRFRTGQMPIVIADAIGTYNTFMGYYELRGLWEMAPLPGMKREDGSINRTSTVTVTALIIPRGANNPNASWEYIKWNSSEETQLRLANESLYVNSNPTHKHSTPNKNALLSLAWTDSEYEAVSTQLKNLAGVPEYPGNYIVSVYVNNAFLDVYNNSADPSTSMLDRILDINKEITRKRKEFHMEYKDITYSDELS